MQCERINMLLPLAGLVEAKQPKLNEPQLEKTESLVADRVKRCFRCLQIKPISEFYLNPHMADRHLGKCKTCNGKDSRENYARKRKQKQIQKRAYYKTEQGKRAHERAWNNFRINNPKYKVRLETTKAILSKKLIRKPCEVCGNPKSEAHHEDYSKPLEVVWLCFKHHRERHGQVIL